MGRCSADHASNAAARSSGDKVFCVAESVTPSTTERKIFLLGPSINLACANRPDYR